MTLGLEAQQALAEWPEKSLEQGLGQKVRSVVSAVDWLEFENLLLYSLMYEMLPKIDMLSAIAATNRPLGPLDARSVVLVNWGRFWLRKSELFEQATRINHLLNHR